MAPRPRHARIFLAEKGVAHPTVNVDLMRQEWVGEAFRAIHPHCTVPELDDGTVLTDITAVVTVDFARVVRVKMDDDHLHLARRRVARTKRRSITA